MSSRRPKDEQPYVYDLTAGVVKGKEGYWFKWRADDFWATLSAVKATLQKGGWDFDPDTKEWWAVEGTDLTPIFANWKGKIEALKLQGKLL